MFFLADPEGERWLEKGSLKDWESDCGDEEKGKKERIPDRTGEKRSSMAHQVREEKEYL